MLIFLVQPVHSILKFDVMNRFFPVLLLPVLFVSCSKSTDTVNVQDLNQQFIGAWNNKDSTKVTALLADDVNFLQGNAHFKGKSEVAKRWVQETMPTVTDLKTNVISSDADTRTAYQAGTFSVDVLPAGYGEGNFMLLWKKGDDGTWKLSYAQLEDLPVLRRQ